MKLPDFLSDFASNDIEIKVLDNIILVTKWNWLYQDCLDFQKMAQNYVRANRKQRIYIFTNHPHVFTLGRGNERGLEDLVTFDQHQANDLPFPLFQIHRGGGITFHYPGQWIFYPICAINDNYSLATHTNWLLQSVRDVLTLDFKIPNVLAANKLVGVWKDRLKLASVGVGVSRFVTEHGLAFNVEHDQKMFDAVNMINPCGMAPTNYSTLEQINPENKVSVEDFHKRYLKHHFGMHF
jgi:lipoyl(octanoyl) transferase